jgi:hypothetical protein
MARGHHLLPYGIIFLFQLLLSFFVNITESYIKALPRHPLLMRFSVGIICSRRPRSPFHRLAMGAENMLASAQLRHQLAGTSICPTSTQSLDLQPNLQSHESVQYRIHQDRELDTPILPSQTRELLEEALEIHLKNRFCSARNVCFNSSNS